MLRCFYLFSQFGQLEISYLSKKIVEIALIIQLKSDNLCECIIRLLNGGLLKLITSPGQN